VGVCLFHTGEPYLSAVDVCPSCGGALATRTLTTRGPAQTVSVEVRGCESCRRLAERLEGTSGGWADAGTDPSVDYLFDWRQEPLPSPWALVTAEKRPVLEAELLAELSREHPLFGARMIAIAGCEGCDEVVFRVDTDPARFVSVHLTWRRAPELPPWPRTEDLGMPLSHSLAGHDH
jgi:hypothetical protein